MRAARSKSLKRLSAMLFLESDDTRVANDQKQMVGNENFPPADGELAKEGNDSFICLPGDDCHPCYFRRQSSCSTAASVSDAFCASLCENDDPFCLGNPKNQVIAVGSTGEANVTLATSDMMSDCDSDSEESTNEAATSEDYMPILSSDSMGQKDKDEPFHQVIYRMPCEPQGGNECQGVLGALFIPLPPRGFLAQRPSAREYSPTNKFQP